jgi:hypothetical protein
MDIKPKHKGQMIYSQNLKCLIELNEENKGVFIREGRHDLFRSSGFDDLKPVEKVVKKPRKKRTPKNDISSEGND